MGILSCYRNIPESYNGDLPKIFRFSGIISKDFSKAKRRLIKEILYGIQAAKDVKLSNISRSFWFVLG